MYGQGVSLWKIQHWLGGVAEAPTGVVVREACGVLWRTNIGTHSGGTEARFPVREELVQRTLAGSPIRTDTDAFAISFRTDQA